MSVWLVLVVRLPSQPSSRRVRAWRRLRTLGAVALKNSVWVLPFSPESYEQLQWLDQEIQRDGGEATLLKVDRVENMAPETLRRLFNDTRDHDYRDLAERYRGLLRALERRGVRRAPGRPADEAGRLAREVERLREAVELRLRPASPAPAPPAPLGALRGRRWVTRPRPHVDRIASAWLIKRFVDPDAEFLFAPAEALPPDAIPFDVLGAELSHAGADCTFETLLRRAGLGDRRLAALAEIVHAADLRDDKYQREEARGLDVALRGLLAVTKDDHEVLATGMRLFDGLYATLGGAR
ncbi:MAG: hypothetical protein A2W08_16765 [Candidatus Rokubacteria bacterium RBG_16_73_20]|nr:MAG: hypothetical protein A2W08_16765 [Candidatus Rokubacteria bacterium RBG_16_73_20]